MWPVWGTREVQMGSWWGKLRKRVNSKDLGIGRRIILQWILIASTGLVWHTLGGSGGLFLSPNWTSKSHKKWGISWPTEGLSASQDGLCLVSYSLDSTLPITCNCHSLQSSRVQLKCDGTRWRTGREVKGKLANEVGSQYPSHYFGTWIIQHYYRWCAHLGCQ